MLRLRRSAIVISKFTELAHRLGNGSGTILSKISTKPSFTTSLFIRSLTRFGLHFWHPPFLLFEGPARLLLPLQFSVQALLPLHFHSLRAWMGVRDGDKPMSLANRSKCHSLFQTSPSEGSKYPFAQPKLRLDGPSSSPYARKNLFYGGILQTRDF